MRGISREKTMISSHISSRNYGFFLFLNHYAWNKESVLCTEQFRKTGGDNKKPCLPRGQNCYILFGMHVRGNRHLLVLNYTLGRIDSAPKRRSDVCTCGLDVVYTVQSRRKISPVAYCPISICYCPSKTVIILPIWTILPSASFTPLIIALTVSWAITVITISTSLWKPTRVRIISSHPSLISSRTILPVIRCSISQVMRTSSTAMCRVLGVHYIYSINALRMFSFI
uniref:Uncharacterized protein n=1 Tax=Heterorhabditis bacteriophora TaxID=37862 RepID=A0A1I7W890_HETBA